MYVTFSNVQPHTIVYYLYNKSDFLFFLLSDSDHVPVCDTSVFDGIDWLPTLASSSEPSGASGTTPLGANQPKAANPTSDQPTLFESSSSNHLGGLTSPHFSKPNPQFH